MKNYYLLILLFYACTSQSPQDVKENEKRQTKVVKIESKFQPFNDVNGTIEILSRIGIGQLSSWKIIDGPNDYNSMTNYFIIENPDGNLKTSNIALYLEGVNQNKIDELQLVLNIVYPKYKKVALKLFADTSKQLFKNLFIPIPDGLLNSIINEKEFAYVNRNYKVTLMLERSGIETWTIKIV